MRARSVGHSTEDPADHVFHTAVTLHAPIAACTATTDRRASCYHGTLLLPWWGDTGAAAALSGRPTQSGGSQHLRTTWTPRSEGVLNVDSRAEAGREMIKGRQVAAA
jgi:hypothetical protein